MEVIRIVDEISFDKFDSGDEIVVVVFQDDEFVFFVIFDSGGFGVESCVVDLGIFVQGMDVGVFGVLEVDVLGEVV